MIEDFLKKIQEEAKKDSDADITADDLAADDATQATKTPTTRTESTTMTHGDRDPKAQVIHVFSKPPKRRKSEMEEALESMAKGFVLAMSEANISSIDPCVFGPLVAFSSIVPKGFTAYKPKFLDQEFFVMERSNRIHTVHKLIDDAYNNTDSSALAFPYIQKTNLNINVNRGVQNIEVRYLIFTEDEIMQISLPYVKEIRIESNGCDMFLVIEVTRQGG